MDDVRLFFGVSDTCTIAIGDVADQTLAITTIAVTNYCSSVGFDFVAFRDIK